MKKKYTLSIAALACAIALGSFFLKTEKGEGLSEYEMENKPRAEWELMLLRDPATGKIPEGIRFKELSFAATLPVRESFLKGQDGLLASGDWKPRGPWNIGGRVRALAVDVMNDNVLLAGGVSGGMWRSADGGVTWQKTTTPDQMHSATSIVQDTRPGKTNVWYYGTGELLGNSASGNGAYFHGNGVFKSTDGGLTWQSVASTATNTPAVFDNNFDNTWNVALDASNLTQDEIYVAAYGTIYRSTDGGAKWTQALGGSPVSYYTDVVVTSTGTVYAALSGEGTKKGLWRSADGISWTNITPENWPKDFKRTVIAIAPSDENQVYFLAETPDAGFEGIVDYGTEIRSEWHSLWKYTDGQNPVWEDRSANLPKFGMPTGDFVSQGSYDLEIAVKPDNPDHVFIGGTNVYRSTDGFKTATKTAWIGGYDKPSQFSKFPQYPNHHSDQHAFVFLKNNPNVLINGNDGGIQKTLNSLADRVEWIPLNNGFITTQFYSVAIDHETANNSVIVGGLQDNGSWFTNSTDVKKNWSKPLGADGAFSAVADGRTAYYLSSQNGKIRRIIMNENGDTLARRRIDPVGGKGYLFINPFILDSRDNNKMYVAGGSILWRNNDLAGIPLDGGVDSTAVNWDSLPNTRITTGKISALASAKTADRLYYGTTDGKVFKMDGVSKGQPQPSEITGSNFPKGAYVNCLAIDPRDSKKVVVVFSNYSVVSLFATQDGGQSWTPVAGNLEQSANGGGNGPSTRWVTILPVGAGTMYLVGTSTGLYSTAFLDGASTTWVQEGASTIGNVVVTMLDSRESDGLVVAATHGNGVYSANITSLPSAAAMPTLIAPESNKKGVLQSLKLEWNPVPGSLYTVEVVDALGASVAFVTGIKDTSYTISNLQQGLKQYFWRVRATNEGGQSPYSQTRSFTTAVAAPVLQTPADAATTERNPLLGWEESEGATHYHVQVSKNLGFSNLVIDDANISGTEIRTSQLDANTKYYWRVSAKNADGEGLFSSRKSFTTNDVTSVRDADNAAIEYLQSYPNPSKNSSTVRFKTAKSGNISLAVFDISGRKIAVLKEGFTAAGDYSVAFKSDEIAAGKYFVTLSANGLLKTIPVEIIR